MLRVIFKCYCAFNQQRAAFFFPPYSHGPTTIIGDTRELGVVPRRDDVELSTGAFPLVRMDHNLKNI